MKTKEKGTILPFDIGRRNMLDQSLLFMPAAKKQLQYYPEP